MGVLAHHEPLEPLPIFGQDRLEAAAHLMHAGPVTIFVVALLLADVTNIMTASLYNLGDLSIA